jgi:hypothetical protein
LCASSLEKAKRSNGNGNRNREQCGKSDDVADYFNQQQRGRLYRIHLARARSAYRRKHQGKNCRRVSMEKPADLNENGVATSKERSRPCRHQHRMTLPRVDSCPKHRPILITVGACDRREAAPARKKRYAWPNAFGLYRYSFFG